MILRPAIVALMLAAVVLLPASAYAATAVSTPTAASSQASSVPSYVTTTSGQGTATVTYDLTWTLPTAGKSGCTVCHGDKDLVRIQGGQTVSLYVSADELQNSAHKSVPCTGCHTDFAYKTPHPNVSKSGNEWRKVAKESCKNCHVDVFNDYAAGAHSPRGLPGETTSGTVGAPNSSAPGMPKPLCGDCHGGHSIPASSNVEAMKSIHLTGDAMCGKCHKKDTASYEDYYHGAAYRASAPDAPACWDCHNTHKILASTDRQSSVYADNLTNTCHRCHSDPRDGYTGYAPLVHGKQKALDANPLYALLESAKKTIKTIITKTMSVFSRSSS